MALPHEPLFIAGWRDVVMLHFAVDAEALQREVPFVVERFDGQAFVSLVCFTLTDMRPHRGGTLAKVLFRPVGTHRYLNVRTYVRHGEETGVFFLAEWLSSRLATWFGAMPFGLPFRFGRLDYSHENPAEGVHGCVQAGEGRFAYRSLPTAREDARPTGSAPESLDEFLLERYTAFTARHGRRGFFRVWHPTWQVQRMELQVEDRSLLVNAWPWFRSAELAMAHHSRGFDEVWMGWPHGLPL
ncbi:MAG: Uncharacterized protein FD161_1125 [Limisphaerales bacterium]|nr:MAG: Uncharacterized protein FD161_1125 [Limisphaerales bacterium]KAG0509684.1 MAG: Uncharacterized protein E1N63_1125 [Limisphaerales bacterium]TXT51197.1 MAG: Uncharacterized protein FD140_1866 [Limisphaerales bacterium]